MSRRHDPAGDSGKSAVRRYGRHPVVVRRSLGARVGRLASSGWAVVAISVALMALAVCAVAIARLR